MACQSKSHTQMNVSLLRGISEEIVHVVVFRKLGTNCPKKGCVTYINYYFSSKWIGYLDLNVVTSFLSGPGVPQLQLLVGHHQKKKVFFLILSSFYSALMGLSLRSSSRYIVDKWGRLSGRKKTQDKCSQNTSCHFVSDKECCRNKTSLSLFLLNKFYVRDARIMSNRILHGKIRKIFNIFTKRTLSMSQVTMCICDRLHLYIK